MLAAYLVALTSCGRVEYRADFALPGSDLVVAVILRHSHPYLAEYDRELLFGPRDGLSERITLFPDTGGYALINLYQIGASSYLVKTIGNDDYTLNVDDARITSRATLSDQQRVVPPDAQFVGAFDFAPAPTWRFIPASERAERLIGEIYNRE